MIKCTLLLANYLDIRSNRQTEQLDTANIGSGEKCTVLRVKPEPCHAAFFTIVCEGIDRTFFWHAVVRLILLYCGGTLRISIVIVGNRLLLLLTLTALWFQVKDLDDTISLAEHE